jgi:beta-lactam-binding protein with PASTA domain/tRNA A-37 threonylcarbamoyl transferase component Bud32
MVLSKRYRLEEIIGEGAMAQVFRGTDLLLERPVAIKVLREQFAADSEAVRRFEYEARAVAKLRHPNIVEVYDVGDDKGLRYIVEELVEGESLRQIIDSKGALPVHQAVGYARQVAQALHAAHRQGIVHRDVKPQNILVDDKGTVKVVDFGIAKALAAPGPTRPGVFWGSPAYIAPEQAKEGETSPSSDIYSLGVVLFEMLTGRLPFEADNPIGMVLAHIDRVAPRPSELWPSVPRWLDDVVLRSLAKNPTQRFHSAEDLEAALASGVQASVAATSAIVARPKSAMVTRAAEPPRIPSQPVRAARSTSIVSIAGLLTILLASAAIGYAAYLAAPAFFQGILAAGTLPTPSPHVEATQTAAVEVPRLIGLTLEQAQGLAKRAGLGVEVQAEQFDAEVPLGTVLNQDPAPKVSVVRGTTIKVTLSKGPEPVAIPGLLNVPFPVAKGILEALGLKVERRDQASQTVAEGAVISSDPPFGSAVPPGSSVTLLVSVGDKVKVPDVFNWPLADAQKAIQAAGLRVGSVNYQTQEDIPHFDITKVGVGNVLSVTPDFNTWVPRGTTIYIAVRAR